ncbi:MAG TPA: hypothetical protein VFA68_11185 [Terriglobales bacterium]|nr:hypothetical protein [Terriglobales bacterium]
MNTPTIAHPNQGGSRAALPESRVVNSVYDLFYRLVRESSPWVQRSVLLVMAAVMSLCALRYFGVYPPKPVPPENPYSLADGKEAVGPGNNAMADVTEHIKQEDAHSRWHEEHPEDSPEFKRVLDMGDDNFLGYKFYAKSDRCVFVVRRESGVTISRWLRNPLSQSAAAASQRSRQTSEQNSRPPESAWGNLLEGLIPSAEAATPFSSPHHHAGLLQAAEASCVSGTHPGEFTYWWGTPEDQCWTPMFRQWKDGCKHYQRFNKCSNGWDQKINWLTCAAPPHG